MIRATYLTAVYVHVLNIIQEQHIITIAAYQLTLIYSRNVITLVILAALISQFPFVQPGL